ncbi:hypothetical protein [Streptomyces cacaoi]|uniref:hypothetical protein n=1 Tax=Streptomyces cacaoi TaxID=1898 RepID=UPI001F3A3EF3|nr:hypothetical protein [Streptomyces cacaoi]
MNCAITSLAEVSSIGVPRKTIRSSMSLEYGSIVRLPWLVRSVNSGRTYRAVGCVGKGMAGSPQLDVPL